MVLILLVLIWCLVTKFSKPPDDIIYPTIHNRCTAESTCGGDLVCDLKTKRCKKSLGGDCSTSVDCETGLVCYNWTCVHDSIEWNNDHNDNDKSKSKKKKSVKWIDQ